MIEDNETSLMVSQVCIDEVKEAGQPDLNGLLVLPTKNMVLFPGVTASLNITRETTLKIVNYCHDHGENLVVVPQLDPNGPLPDNISEISNTGVMCHVLKVIELPGGSKHALLHAKDKIKILGTSRKRSPIAGALKVRVEILKEDFEETPNHKMVIETISCTLSELPKQDLMGLIPPFKPDFAKPESVALYVNTICTNFPFSIDEKKDMLAANTLSERSFMLLSKVLRMKEEAEIMNELMEEVKEEMSEDQRRMIMSKHLEHLQRELYGEDNDISDLRSRADALSMSDDARKAFDKELEKLSHTNPQNAEYSVSYSYLTTLLELPWGKEAEVSVNFTKARKILNDDHFGLDKVKERVLEHVAVAMNSALAGPNAIKPTTILCLVGPPGVGKTSLGRSVANALGLEYQRVALGGLSDEAEIRGHRRTYIGAMPGRIIDAMKRSSTLNPVIVLDEIDKVGKDYKGDPASALLEVLDPEQNKHFHDNYLDVDFDLSKAFFIATANSLTTVPKPLLDRMEVIDIQGYVTEEKQEIANRHLLPRIFKSLNMNKGAFKVAPEAMATIIDTYTNESGVRQLEKKLTAIARKAILAKLNGEKFPKTIKPKDLKNLLGTAPFIREKYEGNDIPGVVTGLAWTETGGVTLLAETSILPGTGKMTATGSLGDVMKESTSIAYQWVKANAQGLGIDFDTFGKHDLHVHFPEGAIPKDGPSAGITIATAIASVFTGKKVRERLAMTGEITLRGKVLPVGGIKEKILAAKRAGITDIALCIDNKKDVDDIAEIYTRGLNFHYVSNMLQVIDLALESAKQ